VGVDIGSAPCELVRPFVPSEPHVCSYVSEVGEALPGTKGLCYFPQYICMCVRVVGAYTSLYGGHLLDWRAEVQSERTIRVV
jgi:hypothetical protein